MRNLFLAAAAVACLAVPALALKPPRAESPASPEALKAFGEANSDDALAAAIAAADHHPLGTLDNPIRAAGPDGAKAYLARLRCADGSVPKLGAIAPGAADSYGTLTDLHPATCGAAPPINLFVDVYHEEHAETRPPAGFTLAP